MFFLRRVHFLHLLAGKAGKWYSPWLVLKVCGVPCSLLDHAWFVQVPLSYSFPASANENVIFYSLYSKFQQSSAPEQASWFVSVCGVKAPSSCCSHLREGAGCFGTGTINVCMYSWIVSMTFNVPVLVFSSHTFTYSLDSGRACEATVDQRHHRPCWAYGVWSKELRRGFTSSGGKEIRNWLCCRETTTGCRSSCYSERLGQQYCVILLALVSCWPQGFFYCAGSGM